MSESGLQSRDDLERLAAAGYRAFLIGERFMTDPDPAARDPSTARIDRRMTAARGSCAVMFVKICGITRPEDARHAVAARRHGARLRVLAARARGVSAPERAREIVAALPASVPIVGVFVNEPLEAIVAIVAAHRHPRRAAARRRAERRTPARVEHAAVARGDARRRRRDATRGRPDDAAARRR